MLGLHGLLISYTYCHRYLKGEEKKKEGKEIKERKSRKKNERILCKSFHRFNNFTRLRRLSNTKLELKRVKHSSKIEATLNILTRYIKKYIST